MVLGPSSARANGRLPGALNFQAGPGDQSHVLSLQTTFGLLLSHDGGNDWQWVCEQAEGLAPSSMVDSLSWVNQEGGVLVTKLDGLSLTADGCTFGTPATSPTPTVIDLAGDTASDVIAAAVTPLDGANSVAVSMDGGATWQPGWTAPSGLLLATIDVAPGHPERMYLSAFDMQGPVILRSDDGGMTFTEMTRDLRGGFDAYLAGVDPTNPDTVYVRSDANPGTLLLRSTDGGQTLNVVTQTQSVMAGFTLSPDGRTLWIAGTGMGEGLERSDDGGMTWMPLPTPFIMLCLRYKSGLLFACADYNTSGIALACSADQGAHFIPVASFDNLPGNTACPAGTTVNDMCESAPPIDASVPHPPLEHHDDDDLVYLGEERGAPPVMDAGRDVVVPNEAGASDATTMEASTSMFRASGGCTCTTQRVETRSARWTVALGLVALAVQRRRRRGRGQSA